MKKLLTIVVIMFLVMCINAQNAINYHTIVEINDVPKKVRLEFKLRYPNSYVKIWYVTNIAYWYNDYGVSYNNWYRERTVIVYRFDQPSNYEVEFYNNDENSRAIYNRYGIWFETRTQLYELPENIRQALQNSKFADWKISDYKERIEIPGLEGSVYRMSVSSKNNSNIIRISDNGKLVQIKTE